MMKIVMTFRGSLLAVVMAWVVAVAVVPSSSTSSSSMTIMMVAAQNSTTCDESTPCQNGGTCHFDDIRQVNYCHCPQGTAGKFCHGTNCPLTCRNGGSCRSAADNALDFFCECVGGYSGDSCEVAPGDEDGTLTGDVQQPASTQSKSGMSVGGKFLVSVLVIVIVGAFAFVFVRRRHPRGGNQSVVDKNAAIHEAETYEDSVSHSYTDRSGDVEDAVKSIEARHANLQSASQLTSEGMDDVEDYN